MAYGIRYYIIRRNVREGPDFLMIAPKHDSPKTVDGRKTGSQGLAGTAEAVGLTAVENLREYSRVCQSAGFVKQRRGGGREGNGLLKKWEGADFKSAPATSASS